MMGCGEGVILGMMVGAVLGLGLALMVVLAFEGREARDEDERRP